MAGTQSRPSASESPLPDPIDSTRYSYDRAAWFYDALGKAYSLGAIGRVKMMAVEEACAGERMLVVGAGSGEEVPGLLRKGAQVTCVDTSQAMLDRLERRLESVPPSLRSRVELRCEGLEDLPGAPLYDVVSANFFLNLYSEEEMCEALARLAALLRPGGRLLIGDFAPYGSGPVITRWLRQLYYRLPDVVFAVMGLAALHPLYDYRRYFAEVGLQLESERLVSVVPGLPLGFVSLVARRVEKEAKK